MKNMISGRFIVIIFIILFALLIAIVIFDDIRTEYIEGEIIDKFIDDSHNDYFRFVILDSDGEYWIAVVFIEDYYSYEIGDWFEGEVQSADNPNSEWE